MVKIKGFQGLVFNPQQYQELLYRDLQHVEGFQQFKDFNSYQLLKKGVLNKQKQEFIYLYQQEFMGLITLGLLAQLSLQDYKNNKIKKHEKTLKNTNLDQKTYANNHVGPVVVGHTNSQQIDNILCKIRNNSPTFSQWKTVDGRKHKLWRIQKYDEIILKFRFIQNLYILDGHHRFQAALQHLQQEQKQNYKQKWIQGILYSTKYIRVYPQFRKLVHEDYETIISDMLKNRKLNVKQVKNYDFRQNKSDFGLYFDNKFYQISCIEFQKIQSEKLAVQKLDQILKQSFEKIQNKIEESIEFVPSLLFDQKNYYQKYPILFFKPPSIDEIFELANEDRILPPKSTWLQPKPCLHMVIRLPY